MGNKIFSEKMEVFPDRSIENAEYYSTSLMLESNNLDYFY
jgi:hypothetical protein